MYRHEVNPIPKGQRATMATRRETVSGVGILDRFMEQVT
jgi:hypothetical protein